MFEKRTPAELRRIRLWVAVFIVAMLLALAFVMQRVNYFADIVQMTAAVELNEFGTQVYQTQNAPP